MSTVLLVEDDHAISMALATRMEAGGFDVVTAFDAVTAGIKSRQCNPDIAVLDISMPGGDGFLVAERLRKTGSATLPLIFITAGKHESLKERAKEFSPIAFLEKPFESEALMLAVNAAAL